MSEESFRKYIEEMQNKNSNLEGCSEDISPNFVVDFPVEMSNEEEENKVVTDEPAEPEPDSSQELDDFIKSEKSKNTVKKTELDWKKFETFCQENTDKEFEIKAIPVPELDKLLSKFFKNIRKKNGEEYEPDSLSSFQKSIQRRIGELKLPYNILTDDAFSRSREVLASKRKNLVKQGRGGKPNASRELTDGDVNKLYEANVFGNKDPLTLQRTIWWFLSMHYGFRARDESRKLCWGDVVLEQDPETGREVLVWRTERGSKTRQGLEGGHRRQFNPKVFAIGTDRCPVHYFKLFKEHRPEKAKTPESPFFLAVDHKNWENSPIWYKCSPLGKNEIGKFLTEASKIAGLETKTAKVSNHSVRKTGISRLLDAGVPENFVMQLSGHKNIQSLSSYKSASLKHQRLMSDTLSRAPTSVSLASTSSSSLTIANQEYSVTSQSAILPSSSSTEGKTMLFPGATISSISHCVFNIIPASEVQDSPSKRQKLA